MPHYDLVGNGTLIDIPADQFPLLLNGFVESCYSFAKNYVGNHKTLLADFRGNYYPPTMARVRNQARVLETQITDERVKERFSVFMGYLNRLAEIDESIALQWAEQIGIPSITSDSDRKRFARKIRRMWVRLVAQPPAPELWNLSWESIGLLKLMDAARLTLAHMLTNEPG